MPSWDFALGKAVQFLPWLKMGFILYYCWQSHLPAETGSSWDKYVQHSTGTLCYHNLTQHHYYVFIMWKFFTANLIHLHCKYYKKMIW
jgi:hypothetical protein